MDPQAQIETLSAKRTVRTAARALYSQRDISDLAGFSRSHLYNLLKRRQFPQPIIRNGPRFTRWSAAEVGEWLADPAAWIATHASAAIGSSTDGE